MKLLTSVLLVFVLSACGPMREDGEYEVYYIDGNINLGIKIDDSGSYHGRVDHKVVAVGANEKYVVAKQLEPGSAVPSYFYIVREKDNVYLNPDEITQGPFTEVRFNELSRKLGLPNFSKEF
ncbi:hypothetical protein [Arenicella sp. 4NH20-0111]|uniref:hypothetical protein n=1 Tax=Arenicella sp. 4NH20-0111 TaxID=3127648 RepID=UPI0033406BA7